MQFDDEQPQTGAKPTGAPASTKTPGSGKKVASGAFDAIPLSLSARTAKPLSIDDEDAEPQAAVPPKSAQKGKAASAVTMDAPTLNLDRLVSSQHASTRAGQANGKSSSGAAGAADFIASKKFAGAKPGYMFKKGERGVGYYLDTASAAPAVKQAALTAAEKAGSKQKQQAKQQQQQQAGKKPEPVVDESDDSGSDDDQEGGGKLMSGRVTQEDLIRQAFAGDDVEDQFAREKAAEVEAELPKEDLPGVLPGWGTWKDQQREPKWMVEQRKKQEKAREDAARNRKDSKLKHVILSEKWDKKAAKYATPSVPFPFKSKEVYERYVLDACACLPPCVCVSMI